ncbi:MAG: hypothetical protein KGH75_14330, partial [Rhodospirillales bacterium]|nr:hypothetical protein [Rhodospirillales bacterium]
WHVTDAGDTFVAHVFGFAHSVDEQSRINARLIASAPELLDALRDVLRIAKAASIGVTGNAPRIARAKAAISKATGESA